MKTKRWIQANQRQIKQLQLLLLLLWMAQCLTYSRMHPEKRSWQVQKTQIRIIIFTFNRALAPTLCFCSPTCFYLNEAVEGSIFSPSIQPAGIWTEQEEGHRFKLHTEVSGKRTVTPTWSWRPKHDFVPAVKHYTVIGVEYLQETPRPYPEDEGEDPAVEWGGLVAVGGQRWELWDLQDALQWLLPRL